MWTHRVPAILVVIEQAQVIERFQFESNGVGTSRVLACLEFELSHSNGY